MHEAIWLKCEIIRFVTGVMSVTVNGTADNVTTPEVSTKKPFGKLQFSAGLEGHRVAGIWQDAWDYW